MEQGKFEGKDSRGTIITKLWERRQHYVLHESEGTNGGLNLMLQRLNVFTDIQLRNIKNPLFLKDLENASRQRHYSSPLKLSSTVLTEMLASIQKTILDFPENAFPIFHDFVFGIGLVAGRLFLATADDIKSQPFLKQSAQQISQTENVGLSLLLERNRDQTKKDRDVLEKDPRGFFLVGSIIDESKKNNPAPLLVHQLVIAGAEAAGKIYKAIYPIAEQVIKPKA